MLKFCIMSAFHLFRSSVYASVLSLLNTMEDERICFFSYRSHINNSLVIILLCDLSLLDVETTSNKP